MESGHLNRAGGADDPIVEMTDGYRDGADLDSPDPGLNRGEAYRHGFANGWDDQRGTRRAMAYAIRHPEPGEARTRK